jgi:hypothetical protein
MTLTSIFVVLYEKQRNDTISLYCMSFMIIGNYGIIIINEIYEIHYAFAALSFLSVLGFMTHHTLKKSYHGLRFLLILAVCFTIATIILFNEDIFLSESLFITTFAVFYLSLHFIES